MSSELEIAIAFARLELLELERCQRSLKQCPGIENVAALIQQAKGLPAKMLPLGTHNVTCPNCAATIEINVGIAT